MSKDNNNQTLAVPYSGPSGQQGVAIPFGDPVQSAPNTAAPVAAAPTTQPAVKKQRQWRPGLYYGIASFVLGILSLVAIIILGIFAIPLSLVGPAAMIPYGIGIVTCIMGIIFGSISKKSGQAPSLSKAGLIMSIIPLALIGVFIVLTLTVCASCAGIFASAVQGAIALL